MLIAKGIMKSFDTLQILKGIDLEIRQGEIVSIVGASGAGKTTLLQILGTLEQPDAGEVTIGGVNPFELTPNKISKFRNTEIGFIFQFHQLLPEFDALENTILPALIKGESMKEAKARGMELLSIMGLENRHDHKPMQLSGGEQQRVAVARSLVNQPKVVFADEPSGNLDSQNSEELHNLFFKLREQYNQTFVIVTHNEKLANMTDRKLVMADGHFVS